VIISQSKFWSADRWTSGHHANGFPAIRRPQLHAAHGRDVPEGEDRDRREVHQQGSPEAASLEGKCCESQTMMGVKSARRASSCS
jgi:hypothetical protein